MTGEIYFCVDGVYNRFVACGWIDIATEEWEKKSQLAAAAEPF